MKKTLLTLLILGATLAEASVTTTFTALDTTATEGNVTYTSPVENSTFGTITGSDAWVTGSASNGGKVQYSSSVALTLDTSALGSITGDTELLRFETTVAAVSYSLFAKLDDSNNVVLTIGYNDQVWVNNSNQTYALSSLSTYTGADGTLLTALAYTLKPINKSNNSGGVRVYSTSSETPIISIPGMGSTSTAYNFNGIMVNTSYVTALSVTNEALAASAAVSAASDLATATIPEPTTATLSLLALAGLATRRRRK